MLGFFKTTVTPVFAGIMSRIVGADEQGEYWFTHCKQASLELVTHCAPLTSYRQADRQIGRHVDRQTDRQLVRQADRETGMQSRSQSDSQTDRQRAWGRESRPLDHPTNEQTGNWIVSHWNCPKGQTPQVWVRVSGYLLVWIRHLQMKAMRQRFHKALFLLHVFLKWKYYLPKFFRSAF